MPTPPLPVIRAVTALSRGLHRLADLPIPPEVRVLNRVASATDGFVLAAFVDLGLPAALAAGPRGVDDLAAEIGADPPTLLRMLRASEAVDLVERRGDSYALTPEGRILLPDAPVALDTWTRYMTSRAMLEGWRGLADAVRSGEPAFPTVNGMSLWQWFAEHPDEERDFAGAMRALSDFVGPDLVRGYPWPPGGTICDVAGGVGSLLSHVLRTEPSLRGVVVDGPGPIALAPRFLASRGVGDRADAVVGDLFGPVEVRADIYLLKDILHDWDDAHCHTILANLATAMGPDSKVVLVESIQEPDRAHPLVPMLDLQMLTQTDGGRQRTLQEFDALFAAHGLRRTRVVDGPTHSLIEASPA